MTDLTAAASVSPFIVPYSLAKQGVRSVPQSFATLKYLCKNSFSFENPLVATRPDYLRFKALLSFICR